MFFFLMRPGKGSQRKDYSRWKTKRGKKPQDESKVFCLFQVFKICIDPIFHCRPGVF